MFEASNQVTPFWGDLKHRFQDFIVEITELRLFDGSKVQINCQINVPNIELQFYHFNF